MDQLAGLTNDARTLALFRFRLLQPHLEGNRPLGSVLIWFLGLSLIVSIALGISKKSEPFSVRVDGPLQCCSPANNQLDVHGMEVFEDVSIRAPKVEYERIIRPAKVTQKLLFSLTVRNLTAGEVVRLSPSDYVGMRLQPLLIWRRNLLEGRRFKPTAFYNLKIISGCLAAVDECDPRLYGSIVIDVKCARHSSEVGPQLLLGGIAREIKGILRRARGVLGGGRKTAEMFGVFPQTLGLSGDLSKSPFRIDDSKNTYSYTSDTNSAEHDVDYQSRYIKRIFLGGLDDPYIGINVLLMFGLEFWAACLLCRSRSSRGGWFLAAGSVLCLVRLGVSLEREHEEEQREYRQFLQHNTHLRRIGFQDCVHRCVEELKFRILRHSFPFPRLHEVFKISFL